jgi:peroxiredoxin
LERFGALSPRFEALDVRLFALSLQEVGYQQELATRLGLPFPLLSDTGEEFSGALALPSFATGGQTYLKRLTLVVRDGAIEVPFYPVPDPATHADEVLAWLEKATR